MGLLDDAIREHLDLKRRRGADPNEVARQEQEALGPPRTGQFATLGDDADDEDAFGPEPEEPPPYATEEMALPPQQRADPAASVAAELYEERAEDELADEEPWPDDTRPEPRGAVDRSTAEPAVSDPEPPPPAGDDAEEDVLEETPEFLQETPEHDRLWFEQRPPRDFDFDK
jgi:hypothetical protein